MRRVVLWTAVGLLAIAGTPGSARAGASVVLGEDVSAPNCPAIVTVSLVGGDKIVAGAQVDLLVPDAPFDVPNPNAACTLAPGVGGEVSTAVVSSPPPPAGMLRLRVLVRGNGHYEDGPLATCQLRTVLGTSQSTQTVTADHPRLAHDGGSQIAVAGLNGRITVSAPTMCCP